MASLVQESKTMSDPIRLGIFGWPVAHSKSPQMHESAARSLGIALRYELFAVKPEGLADAVREKHAEGIDGYNLTVPHKRAVMTLLDEVAPSAGAIGAVNTVVRADDRYVGHNTDAPGFVRSLEEAGVEVAGARVAVVGAGGAARAGVVGLGEAGAESIVVLARRPEQADELVRSLEDHVPCELRGASLHDAQARFGDATLLVQATSATLGSNPHAAEFAESLPIESLPTGAAVVDMVYQPRRTAVLQRAEARGLVTVDGLGMLLHQGAIAFEMWTGFEPPLDVMRAALTD
jgi:shikimate dehydrogenase